MAENIDLSIDDKENRVTFQFEYARFKEKVVNTLNDRLIGWEKFVRVLTHEKQ